MRYTSHPAGGQNAQRVDPVPVVGCVEVGARSPQGGHPSAGDLEGHLAPADTLRMCTLLRTAPPPQLGMYPLEEASHPDKTPNLETACAQ